MNRLLDYIKRSDQFLSAIFDWVSNLFINAEVSFVTMISTVIPYSVLLIPAYLIRMNILIVLEQSGVTDIVTNSGVLANVTGFNVAGMGISIASTYFSFLTYDRKTSSRTKKEYRLPWWALWAPVVMYVFYFGIVITINIILEGANLSDPDKMKRVLFQINMVLVFLEIPAVVLASLRTWQASLLKSKNEGVSGDGVPQHVSYDYRVVIGGLSLDEKIELFESGKNGMLSRFPGIHPERPAKWIKNLARDIEKEQPSE